MHRTFAPFLAACCLLSPVSAAVASQPQASSSTETQPSSIVGLWTLDKGQSDQAPAEPQRGGRDGNDGTGGPGGGGGRRGGGGYGGGGRRGGGGFGGGGFGGPGGGAPPVNPQEMQRRRDALRDIMEAPDKMTITRTDSMVIITTGDGRTTRLSTDGKKVKDDSTGIERKTHWDGEKLVSEITGAGRSKITETYAFEPDSHQLVVSLLMDGGGNRNGNGQPAPRKRVYVAGQP